MKPPTGRFTLAQAAEKWIELIESDHTADAEKKAGLIAEIRAALPSTRWIGVGTVPGVNDGPNEKCDFATACNNIKRVIRAAREAK